MCSALRCQYVFTECQRPEEKYYPRTINKNDKLAEMCPIYTFFTSLHVFKRQSWRKAFLGVSKVTKAVFFSVYYLTNQLKINQYDQWAGQPEIPPL